MLCIRRVLTLVVPAICSTVSLMPLCRLEAMRGSGALKTLLYICSSRRNVVERNAVVAMLLLIFSARSCVCTLVVVPIENAMVSIPWVL